MFLNRFWTQTVTVRPVRSTASVDRTRGRSTRGRPTCTDLCMSGWHRVRSTGRSTGYESCALWILRSTGRSTSFAQRSEYDRWTVDRPVDR